MFCYHSSNQNLKLQREVQPQVKQLENPSKDMWGTGNGKSARVLKPFNATLSTTCSELLRTLQHAELSLISNSLISRECQESHGPLWTSSFLFYQQHDPPDAQLTSAYGSINSHRACNNEIFFKPDNEKLAVQTKSLHSTERLTKTHNGTNSKLLKTIPVRLLPQTCCQDLKCCVVLDCFTWVISKSSSPSFR